MLPTFFLIGAMKGGTTSLAMYLSAHPQVFMAQPKEPDYFAAERNWRRGREWYESLFEGAGDAVAIGEASPSYTQFPVHGGVAERIAQAVPDAKLIYLVREPVERMRSQYIHWVSEGWESRHIHPTLLTDARYMYPSRYGLQVEQYLAHFDRSQLLVVTSEALRDARPRALETIAAFLGLDAPWPASTDTVYHRSAVKRVPRPLWRRVRMGTATSKRFHRVAPRLRRLQENNERVFTRRLDPADVEVSPELREKLTAVLRPDIDRLRELAAGRVDEADLARWEIS